MRARGTVHPAPGKEGQSGSAVRLDRRTHRSGNDPHPRLRKGAGLKTVNSSEPPLTSQAGAAQDAEQFWCIG